VHIEPSHWLHQISISKSVCHHLQHGLIKPPNYKLGVIIHLSYFGDIVWFILVRGHGHRSQVFLCFKKPHW
jgi:hypothetical protein